MDALILALYALCVWLVFFKFKWLPWNTTSMVIVVTIPVVALTTMILLLNVFAPSSNDVRVIKYVVNIVPQVGGRVIEVPVQPNRLVKKGEVLFRLDPTPYALTVRALQAQLANTQASLRESDEQLAGAAAGVTAARSAITQADARAREVQVSVDLARRRVEQNRELVASGAGDRFALEKAEADLASLRRKPTPRARWSRSRARPRCRPTPRSGRSGNACQASWATNTRRWRRCARSSNRRNGIWNRPPWSRRPTATPSTCSCARARSPPPSRSRRR
jgi:multidrug resistance efflux pump